jgi:MoxR-like ATPase
MLSRIEGGFSMSRQLFKQVENELNQTYFERREEIRGLLVALLSKQHVLLLGAPGTSKSAMTEDLCKRIGGKYFKKLVARTTTPEELFGPVSLKALENDSYRRVTTGKLPEAEISFIDEIFKCNSAVLNGMLGIINEREFENDGQVTKCPLQSMVGASNELPEDREELGALWDRFLLRYVVKYIRDPRNFEAMLQGGALSATTKIPAADLQQAQSEVQAVDVSKVVPQFTVIRQKMAEKNIPVSDRRWKQTLSLIKANAWLEGRKQASDDDLEILAHALWQDPGQIPEVKAQIMQLANPLDKEALELFDQAAEIYQGAIDAPENKKSTACLEANSKFKKIAQRLEVILRQARDSGKNDSRILDALTKVTSWNKEIVNTYLL